MMHLFMTNADRTLLNSIPFLLLLRIDVSTTLIICPSYPFIGLDYLSVALLSLYSNLPLTFPYKFSNLIAESPLQLSKVESEILIAIF